MSEEQALELASQSPSIPKITDVSGRMLEVGTIRSGYKDDRGYPVKLDFYVICDKRTEKLPNGRGKRPLIRRDIMELIAKREGVTERHSDSKVAALDGLPKIQQLDVMVMFDAIDLTFITHRAAYSKRAVLCKGHGKGTTAKRSAKFWEGEGDAPAEYFELPCHGVECPWTREGKCKPHGILKVLLLDDPMLGGIYIYRTTSHESIAGILGGLESAASLTGGRIAGLPFKLRVIFKDGTFQDGQGRTRDTQYPVSVIGYAGGVRKLLTEVQELSEQRALLGAQAKAYEQKMLEEAMRQPEDEDPEVVIEVATEVHEPPPPESEHPGSRSLPPADGSRPQNQRPPQEIAKSEQPPADDYEGRRAEILAWINRHVDELGGVRGVYDRICMHMGWSSEDWVPPSTANLEQLLEYKRVLQAELDNTPF